MHGCQRRKILLVTCGAGLIGSSTVDLLLRKYAPAQIVVLDDMVHCSLANLERAQKEPRVTFIQGDICNVELVRRVTMSMGTVMHFAAFSPLVPPIPGAPCRRCATAASRSWPPRRRRSASWPNRSRLVKTILRDNRTWYGASKPMLEGLLRTQH